VAKKLYAYQGALDDTMGLFILMEIFKYLSHNPVYYTHHRCPLAILSVYRFGYCDIRPPYGSWQTAWRPLNKAFSPVYSGRSVGETMATNKCVAFFDIVNILSQQATITEKVSEVVFLAGRVYLRQVKQTKMNS